MAYKKTRDTEKKSEQVSDLLLNKFPVFSTIIAIYKSVPT